MQIKRNALGFVSAILLVLAILPLGAQINLKPRLIQKDRIVFDFPENCMVLSAETGVESAIENVDNAKREISVGSLNPSQFFELKGKLLCGGDTLSYQGNYITASGSSGEIKIYFNQPVDASFSRGNIPDGTTYAEVEKALREAIRNAKTSIDYAAYNTNEMAVVNELIDAAARGVKVRCVADGGTSNTGLQGGMPFKIVKNSGSSGLMHHKFIVIDPEDSERALIVTGSMNFTKTQMRTDPNHLLFIQDKSLALTYQKEFNEMWGSQSLEPDLSKSRFGDDKLDDTPHHFLIGDTYMECYFSPSDNTTSKIAEVLDSSRQAVNLALMIFTNWELRDQMKKLLERGIKVRTIIEDDYNSLGVMSVLTNSGGLVAVHHQSGNFHHKYAIIDEDLSEKTPVVVTGSHNWTYSAETINDENTLIIHDSRIANIFRQEYEARWKEVYFSSSTSEQKDIYTEVYPHPVTDRVCLSTSLNVTSVKVYHTITGKSYHLPLTNWCADVAILPVGAYLMEVSEGDMHSWVKLIKI